MAMVVETRAAARRETKTPVPIVDIWVFIMAVR
jgi:hypothetical protein